MLLFDMSPAVLHLKYTFLQVSLISNKSGSSRSIEDIQTQILLTISLFIDHSLWHKFSGLHHNSNQNEYAEKKIITVTYVTYVQKDSLDLNFN